MSYAQFLAKGFIYSLALSIGLISSARADLIKVLYPQGAAHGFVEVTTLDGKRIGTGDLQQTVRRTVLTSRLTLRFKDGSIDDETTVFEQGNVFRLIRDSHTQHGPSFPHPSETLVDARSGLVTVTDESGKVTRSRLTLPPDTYNGMASAMVMNVNDSTNETSIAIAIPSSSPRIAHLELKRAGKVHFSIGDETRVGQEFILHVNLGFVAGVIAPLIGESPADYRVMVSEGPVPAFIRMEGQLYVGGPIVRIQQVSASFPSSAPSGP